jgi:hypothetical protein
VPQSAGVVSCRGWCGGFGEGSVSIPVKIADPLLFKKANKKAVNYS